MRDFSTTNYEEAINKMRLVDPPSSISETFLATALFHDAEQKEKATNPLAEQEFTARAEELAALELGSDVKELALLKRRCNSLITRKSTSYYVDALKCLNSMIERSREGSVITMYITTLPQSRHAMGNMRRH